MYVALSSSWALFCGSSRYLSLATSAFFGIGAYTSALALEHMPWLAAVALGAGIKALDSTYLRMTVCFMEQELQARINPDAEQKADLDLMLKDMEALLARMG